jgi:hypothetical protein
MDTVTIDRNALPADEHEPAQYIETNLVSLFSAADSFRDTADLYLHARELRHAWVRIAGRNGAIEAYSFMMVMQLIAETRAKAPTIWSRIDPTKKDEATKLFADEFPTIAGIRNSTAHPGQLSGDPSEIEKHRLKDALVEIDGILQPANRMYIADSMKGDDTKLEVRASFKGKLVAYELSHAKADALMRVATFYSEAFYPLEQPIYAERRSMLRQMREILRRGQSDRQSDTLDAQ